MTTSTRATTVAVIGAGIAGSACADGLQRAGCEVTVFDKSRGPGGRMATRHMRWTDAEGTEQSSDFDHGAQHFSASTPRFRALMARAEAAGVVSRWQPRVHARWPAPMVQHSFVATPTMPALCRHLLKSVSLRVGAAVQRLYRQSDGWHLVIADGEVRGPFDQVMLAMPPAQAALLLAGHHDEWADALATVPMQPCWTLMAITNDVDWPWDAAEPDRGALGWVARNERKPGRSARLGLAHWVAHATPAWTAAHLEEDPLQVRDALCVALAKLLPQQAIDWHQTAVHRWRYALPQEPPADQRECWWDAEHGLGVCGDFFGAGQVEAAWRSGDELADTMAASLEESDLALVTS